MIRGDEPIKHPDDDVLGRTDLAAVIASEIRRIDASQGFVVGVLGPWGSGKTSLINLIRNGLASSPSIPVVDFNPWLFSGTDQLVERFFIELAAQLRLGPSKLDKVAEELESYGEIIAPLQALPIVGAWIERASDAAEALKSLREKQRGGVETVREKIAKRLSQLDSPILIVVDDIDRLRTSEIRDIFKLVRLTGSFPNLIYLVAFDRARVESALAEDGLSGRDYLEKIIQVTYDIPITPDVALHSQVVQATGDALDGIENPGPFDTRRWVDLLFDVIRPLIRTMRDLRRYVAPLRATVESLGGRVDLGDVLALEAVRIFLPDVFAQIIEHQDVLTGPTIRSTLLQNRNDQDRAAIEAVLDAAGPRREIADRLIRHVFPSGYRRINNWFTGAGEPSDWLRESKMAHESILAYYLERSAGKRLQAFWDAETVVNLLSDPESFRRFMRAKESTDWEDILVALDPYENDLPAEVALAVPVILDLYAEMPDRPKSLLEPETRYTVLRTLYVLLRRLPDEQAIEAVVRDSLAQSVSLSAKRLLLYVVGHDEEYGQKLVGADVSARFEAELRNQIRATPAEILATEPNLIWILGWAKTQAQPGEASLPTPDNDTLIRAILKNAVTESRMQGMGTRYVEREKRLLWNQLLGIFGSEDAIRQLVDSHRDEREDPLLKEAVDLAERYLAGWDPDRY